MVDSINILNSTFLLLVILFLTRVNFWKKNQKLCQSSSEDSLGDDYQINITEYKRMEETLPDREERFREIVEQAVVGIALIGKDGKFLQANPNWYHLLGNAKELQQLHFNQITGSGELVLCLTAVERSSETDSDNYLNYAIAIITDINERKRTQEERDQFFNNSLDLLCIIDFKGYFRRINPAFIAILGYSPPYLLETPFLELIHADDHQATLGELEELRQGHLVLSFENRYLCQDGSYKWLSWVATPDLKESLIYAVAKDITCQKNMKEQLKESQARLNSILDSLQDIIWSYCLESNQFLYLNQAIADISGYQDSEFLNNTKLWEDIVFEKDKIKFKQAFFAIQERGTSQDLEYRIVHKNGKIKWISCRAQVIYNQGKKMIRIDGIARDITEKKQSEKNLKESEERLRQLITTISDGLIVVDSQGYIQFINQATESFFGRSCQELIKHPFGLPIIGQDKAEITISHTDGEFIIAEMRVTEIIWEQEQAYLISLRDISERYQSEQALQESEAKYRQIVETAIEGIWVLDHNSYTTFANQQMARMLGYTIEEMMGKSLLDFMDEAEKALALTYLELRRQGIQEIHDFKFRRRDGTSLWAIVSTNPLFDQKGNYIGTLGMLTDITERKQIETALSESEKRLESILSSIEDVIWSSDAQTLELLYLNKATEKIYGRSLEEFYQNSNLWLEVVHADDRERVSDYILDLMANGHIEIEYRILRPDGEIRWLYDRSRLVYDAQNRPIRIDGIATDITQRKQAETLLQRSAFYDPLTDLPNRALLMDRLEHTLQRFHRHPDKFFAVLFLDLDEFKVINDSLGHMVGDKLLQEMGLRLQSCLRSCDTLARLGGDEFVILLEDIEQMADAITITQRIHHQFSFPFNLKGQEIFTNVSIGIALSHRDYEEAQAILRDADTAMYRAKAMGKARYAIFDQQMHQQVVNRLQTETDLRRALERQEFLIHYQPIISLQTRQITGFEALIRWHHPDKGLVSPAQFIPVAEETGLIVPIGQWILQAACEQLQLWQSQLPAWSDLQISVNLSSKQLRDEHLLEFIDEVLTQTQLNHQSLKLEITESILMENVEVATDLLLALREREIELCLDDFGTGYSSLSYLHRFPVNTLKIDRSFVMGMQPGDENTEIIRTIITLAHTLGLDTIAEGIETELQLMQLRELGCKQGQGYYFAKPLTSAVATALLENTTRQN